MNDSTQKRQIQRFLRGQDKRAIDAFSIYQWIERCHSQEWWRLAIELSPHITPGSLKSDYQKRLDVILKECRTKQYEHECGKLDKPDPGFSPRHPIRKIIRGPGSPSGSQPCREELSFDNEAKQTLRQIYSVLYYMQRNHDFVDAVRRTKDNFNIAYQSVDDKCARRFAGTVDMFQRWYRSGEILQRLKDHFHLNYHDCKNFEELLTSKFKRDL